jgi:hypothetical protein
MIDAPRPFRKGGHACNGRTDLLTNEFHQYCTGDRAMNVVMLSRLQFAAATMFHFLFVPLTLGLSVLVAIMETKY